MKTPELSPLPDSYWSPFVTDDHTQSYSYLLKYDPNRISNFHAQDRTTKDCDTNNTNNPLIDRFLSQPQHCLDEWMNRLHPSQYEHDETRNLNQVHNDENQQDIAWTDAYYQGQKLLRKTAWIVLDNDINDPDMACQCQYGYSDTWQPISNSLQLNQVVQEMTHVIRYLTGDCSINSCNLNYYPQGGGVGYHADDEFLFDSLNRPTQITSLSLCRPHHATRLFQVQPRENALGVQRTEEEASNDTNVHSPLVESCIQQVALGHGDIMTMEGMFQKHYFHSIWPGDCQDEIVMNHPQAMGERINLTWRTIVQHLDGSSECRGKICPRSRLNGSIHS